MEHYSPDFIIRKARIYLASGAAPWEAFLSGFSINDLDEIIHMCEIQKNAVTNDFLQERFPPGQIVTLWKKRPTSLVVRTSTTHISTKEPFFLMDGRKVRVKEVAQRGFLWQVVVYTPSPNLPNSTTWVPPEVLTWNEEPREMSSLYDEIRLQNTKSALRELLRRHRAFTGESNPVYLPEDAPMIWEQLASKLIMEPDIQKAHAIDPDQWNF